MLIGGVVDTAEQFFGGVVDTGETFTAYFLACIMCIIHNCTSLYLKAWVTIDTLYRAHNCKKV